MPFPYAQQTWTDGVSSASAARLAVIEAGVALAGVTGTSSTPPASPTDGMIWRLPAASASGIYWWFQYDSSQTTNKWVFMGGSPMSSSVTTDETTTSATYVDLATVGPSVTVPRAGDYLIEMYSHFNCVTANGVVLIAAKLGAAATADTEAIKLVAPAVSNTEPAYRKLTARALAASDVVKMQYKTSAGTAHFLDRAMFVTPIRII